MKRTGIWICFITGVFLSPSQQFTVNIDKLVKSINTDNNNTTISDKEVESFFMTLGGPVLTRCSFMDKMTSLFNGDPPRVSVMFDAMQSSDGQMLTTAEWRYALMGYNTMLNISSISSALLNLDDIVDRVLRRPSDNVDRPMWFRYTELDVQRLVDRFDSNGDGRVTRYEVSNAMRSMDNNNDYVVRRCSFVDVMTSYEQHGAAASNLYDVLFSQRDVTWADVDSDFFLTTADDNGDCEVTRKELVDYFNVRNKVAAGLWVDAAGETTDVAASSLVMQSFVPLMVTLTQYLLWLF